MDFTVELSAACVLDGAVAVFDSVAGVQPQSRRSGGRRTSTGSAHRIHQQDGYHQREPLRRRAVDARPARREPGAAQIPVGNEDNFTGVVDLVEMQAVLYKETPLGKEFETVEIPAKLVEQAQEYHHQLIDAISLRRRVLAAYIEDESR